MLMIFGFIKVEDNLLECWLRINSEGLRAAARLKYRSFKHPSLFHVEQTLSTYK